MAGAILFHLALGMTAGAKTLFQEDFQDADPTSGLPSGWGLRPPAHAPFFSTSCDSEEFGLTAPALRVDVPLNVLNYYICSPRILLPHLDEYYTLELSLRIDQPDAPFVVEMILRDSENGWIDSRRILDLPGEEQDTLRTYRASFRPAEMEGWGSCIIALGLPYTKVLREGRFWLDDVQLREGREVATLEAYVRPGTVAPGEDLEVCVSAARETAVMEVFLEAESPVTMLAATELTGLAEQPIPPEVWRQGCRWPAATTVAVGADWPSGLYRVRIDDGDRSVSAFFIVRGQGTEGPVLVILPTHTEQAYNRWGGKSFYVGPTLEVSFDRPFDNYTIGAYMVPIHLLRWLWREGIGHGVAGDDDLHDRPEMLADYAGIIIPGHSEYWTGAMRSTVERYIDGGGSVMCLSGNTCWWQTRITEEPASDGLGVDRRLVCYKYSAGMDPYWNSDPSLVTTRWDESPLFNPSTRFLGLSWRYGGHVNWSVSYNCPCPYDWLTGHGGYQVFHTDHWVFAGTGIQEGETFGQSLAIVGYEVDGAPIEWIQKGPVVLPQGGTPAHFRVLGLAPCWNYLGEDEEGSGVALMGIMEQGQSFVFNGGTTGWCWGLAGDPMVQQVTRNLITHLGAPPSARPVYARPHVYPNPCRRGLSIEVCSETPVRRVRIYDVSGRRVGTPTLEWLSPVRSRGQWDLRNESGIALPAGIYHARVEGGGTRSFVVIR